MENAELKPSKYSGQAPKLLSGCYKWVKWLFYASALGNLLMLIGAALLFTLDLSTYDAAYDFSYADWFLLPGALIYTIAFIGGVIAFSIFSFRAMENLHIWMARSAEMSPGWTVGWYFIPFANLWKPFQAMSQIWDGTTEVTAPNSQSYPSIGVWWLFWIITNISANVSFRLTMNGDFSNSNLQFIAIADIVSAATGIGAVLVIIPILQKISEMQDAKTTAGVFS